MSYPWSIINTFIGWVKALIMFYHPVGFGYNVKVLDIFFKFKQLEFF